ncbi:GGDEF domain-containing protein [Pelomonas sp. V22]|uniref:GGDEF domain-containing protein n=1 Tax=Pelomonas sp. V22 TaxID=2822139 RepID=UPI0024A840DE|nr:GGDEF domain-containing protein [Pelomonas sp. V22]MDI4633775.1 GGDEF domain-containing protein [Pelomonas sp. V22]
MKQAPAQIAKAALRQLALDKLEPTPENYARAYAAESGEAGAAAEALPEKAERLIARLLTQGVQETQARLEIGTATREGRWDDALRRLEKLAQSENPGAQAESLAILLERLVRGLERGGKSWTVARKKDGLQRVLESNRSDFQRLLARLRQLVSSWDSDANGGSVDTAGDDSEGGTPSQFFTEDEMQQDTALATASGGLETLLPAGSPGRWPDVAGSLHGTVQHALRAEDERAQLLMSELDRAHARLQGRAVDEAEAQAIESLCQRARLMLDHRAHLFGELGGLVRELTASLAELAEDDSWAQGQCEAMNNQLALGLSARGVRSVGELLTGTRERQKTIREERSKARDSLKTLIHKMLAELGELGQHTDRFQDSVGRYAEVIEKADSLESLTGVVREMVEESRTVQALVKQTQGRLSDEHSRATELSKKVDALEDELRRLSAEVQTDQLTKIANRRGLIATFTTEQAKFEREGTQLSLALLDIDNFKKLNDTLGHAAGDQALVSLAARCTELLRPGDLVARYGGEEFVLLLPRTPIDEAVQVLTRLQRSLSASLFMHEGQQVFVTFSAGVTLYRQGETLESALDRADEALYQAKHTGKNRACVAE